MGKGKPAPRETATEKKTKPQKAVATKAIGKKTAAAAPRSEKSTRPNTGKPVPEKESGAPGGPAHHTAKPGKAKATVVSDAAVASRAPASPVKPAEPVVIPKAPEPVVVPKPPEQERPVQKPVTHQPAAQHPAAPTPAEADPEVDAKTQPKTPAEAEPGELDGVRLPSAGGKVGVFGGPKDRSVKPDDKLGLPTGRHYQFEQFRSLNPRSYYCAMRWEYRQQHMSAEEGKRWWANKKIAVTNPANSRTVVVRAVDYGPHETSGLTIAISPGAAEAIGVEPGQEVVVAFADEKSQIGPVTAPLGAAD